MSYARTHQPAPQPYRGNTPPRSASPHAGRAGETAEAMTLLGLITDGQQGWLEISAILGDPDDRRSPAKGARRPAFAPASLERMGAASRAALLAKWGHVYGREWMYIRGPQDVAAAARRCLELGRRFGDVYVSSGLYAERSAKRDAAMLPSRVIFLDDAPTAPALPYTLAIETSAGSFHGYYITRERLTTTERVELQRRAAYATDSDKSGADAQQIVRVPGTRNTKAKAGNYPVHIAHQGGPVYAAAELAAAWPTVPVVAADEGAIDDQSVAHWLANIECLVDPQGVPYGVKSEAARALWRRSWDSDTSGRRWTLARSLIINHGYPDDQAAAILYHTAGECGNKGDAWLWRDIARVISKARAECPPDHQIRPRGLAGDQEPTPAAPLPTNPRRAAHRPARLTAAAYLAWLEITADGSGAVPLKREAIAAELGVSEYIIGRLERQLRDEGKCYRETCQHVSWVRMGAKPDESRVSGSSLPAVEMAPPPVVGLAEVPTQPNAETASECEKSNDVYGIKEHIAPPAPGQPAPAEIAPTTAASADDRAQSPARPAAAVAVVGSVPSSPGPDGQPLGELTTADDWAALMACDPGEDAEQTAPPADAADQLAALECSAPPSAAPTNQQIVIMPRRRIETAADLAPAAEPAPRPRTNVAALKARGAAFDGKAHMDQLRAKWRQREAVTQHNNETPPPPAAPAAPPVAPGLPDGIDWAAARAAWDACLIGKFCEDRQLDREAVIDHLISAALAA